MLSEILHKIAGQFQDEPHQYYPRPSLAGPERCIRQMVYQARGDEAKPLPGRTLHVFDDGNWHELLTADWIQLSTFKLHSEQMEVEIEENGLTLTGHIDGIIMDLLRVDRLWEHKSINHFTFERIWNGKFPYDYITQVCLYIRGVQAVNPDITEGLLLIKNKNTSQFLELLIRYQADKDTATVVETVRSTGERKDIGEEIPGVTHAAFEKFAAVQKHVDTGTLPDRQYDRDHWRCCYCGHLELCWADYEKEFEQLAESAELNQEIADLCAYYLETNMHFKEMEKEQNSLKEQIKSLLEEKAVRRGKAGPYLIERKLQKREYLNRERVPPSVWESFKIIKEFEILKIRKLKN
ncbi:MAG: hypothetical protein KAU14_06090 [Thermoplasmata archaeon]|nr:hypothetical protein [Thermoplasmata archaeon]